MTISNKHRRKFLTICYGVPGNVVFSQLIEYTLLMKEYGINFDYNFMIPGMSFMKNKALFNKDMANLKKTVEGAVNVFPAPFTNSEFFIKLYKNYIKHRAKVNNNYKTIVHPRGLPGALVAYKMRKDNKNVSYIYDMRGDSIAELEFHDNCSHKSLPDIENDKLLLFELEAKLVKEAGHVLCVSSELRKIALDRYSIQPEKVTVVPCCANGNLFSPDELKRDLFRSELKLNGKFVLAYCGGLNLWHCAEEMFRLVGGVLKSIPNAVFVVLTPHKLEALSLSGKFLPKNRYLINNVPREEVFKYLSASDIGVILRKDDPVNRVSSPTKIAEYLISGLPVIISDNIGDYSNIIKEKKMGIVLSNTPLNVEEDIDRVTAYINRKEWCSKSEISDYGINNFSKEKYVPKLREIYYSL